MLSKTEISRAVSEPIPVRTRRRSLMVVGRDITKLPGIVRTTTADVGDIVGWAVVGEKEGPAVVGRLVGLTEGDAVVGGMEGTGEGFDVKGATVGAFTGLAVVGVIVETAEGLTVVGE